MSEEYVVRQCAPTLAGIKTGSLFPCPYQSRQALMSEIRALNRRLSPKGLILLPVRYLDGKALLYLYRPSNLRQDLKNRLAAQVLEQAGYSCSKSEQCVVRLIRRLKENEDFPHEIGLFLSYPPEDVKGFIDNHAANSKCAGVWKVYGDEQRARQTFEKYKKCTQIYCDLWRSGSGLDQLAVAG